MFKNMIMMAALDGLVFVPPFFIKKDSFRYGRHGDGSLSKTYFHTWGSIRLPI